MAAGGEGAAGGVEEGGDAFVAFPDEAAVAVIVGDGHEGEGDLEEVGDAAVGLWALEVGFGTAGFVFVEVFEAGEDGLGFGLAEGVGAGGEEEEREEGDEAIAVGGDVDED